MPGKIYRYLADDHRRLEALLEGAMVDPENIDGAAYAQFPLGFLKHIGMEEKVLLPAAQNCAAASHRGCAQAGPRSRRIALAAGAVTDGAGGCSDPRDPRGP
jgi:hypothetical protein